MINGVGKVYRTQITGAPLSLDRTDLKDNSGYLWGAFVMRQRLGDVSRRCLRFCKSFCSGYRKGSDVTVMYLFNLQNSYMQKQERGIPTNLQHMQKTICRGNKT